MHPWVRWSLSLGSMALGFIACSGPSGWSSIDSPPLESLQLLRPPPDAPDAGAMVVLDEGSLEVFGDNDLGFSVFDRHRIIKIFTPGGHRYANIVIPYGATSMVSGIEARTVTPAGRSVELRDDDIFDVSLYPNFVFFSDQRARIFTLPAIENGSLIEYRYRIRIQNRGLWHAWNFQEDIPVLRSRFTLVKPSEWNILFRTYGRDVPPTVITAPAGFKSRHVWETSFVPPLTSEFGMPPSQELTARLALAPVGFSAWPDVSRWYHDIAEPRMSGGSLVKALADSLTFGLDSPRARLQAIFEWVRDHVRYIAVEIGIGGYQPHDAEEVVAKRYGDCKDMVVAVCALARRADIPVHPVMISTHDNGRPDTSLPSPFQFNHLIAYAPDVQPGGIWMDATEKACRFSTLPWYDQGRAVVIASKDADSTLHLTPTARASENSLQVRWDAVLQENGAAAVTGTNVLTGAVATELRHELRSARHAEQREWLENFLSHRTPVAVLDTFMITGLGPETDSLVVSYQFRSASFATRRPSTMILRPREIIGSTLSNYFRSPSRTHPVRFRFGSQSALSLTLQVPSHWEPAIPQRSDSLQSAFGQWHATWEKQEDTIVLRAGYAITGEDVQPRDYPAFQRFLDATRVRDQQELILTRIP
ncbi:MAG: Transglutaminase-like enzyme, putative cysteine protease [Bacteroidetes bacterium]|nr:Transglutaminase-like enzyme, putative cysteine protease [Bacteroidota bacterium]